MRPVIDSASIATAVKLRRQLSQIGGTLQRASAFVTEEIERLADGTPAGDVHEKAARTVAEAAEQLRIVRVNYDLFFMTTPKPAVPAEPREEFGDPMGGPETVKA